MTQRLGSRALHASVVLFDEESELGSAGRLRGGRRRRRSAGVCRVAKEFERRATVTAHLLVGVQRLRVAMDPDGRRITITLERRS